jgi:hypothetical protein
MMVIYHDVGGAHSVAAAAYMHINRLPMDRVPDSSELLSVPNFDKIEKEDIGHLIYIGDDEFGAKVYTLARKYKPELVIPAITDMYNIINGGRKGLYLVDTTSTINMLMKIGGFSSRRLKLVLVGRPIVTKGTLNAYMNIAAIVQNVKECIKRDIEG